MEDRQLNFNQPLLSVRRFSSTVASKKDVKRKTDNPRSNLPPLPFYRSELKSGPVRNPGTVPFTWEQSPGRPKDESKSQTKALEGPPIIPKLPPGRIMKDKGSEDLIVTRSEAGKVPSSSQCVLTVEENKMKFENSKGAIEETESSDSGESQEEYLDALDTLSRTESFFLNCSLSGLSGLDGPEVKPSGIFTTDPQTWDFMMRRFLPAAKAMASETPQYAPRKQPVARDQPRQMMKVTSAVKKPPLYRSRPNILPKYTEDNVEEEIADEDDDYDDPGNLSTKVCGLLPRFCLLNPVPGMSVRRGTSVRTRVPRSPFSRMQTRSSSQCQETHNKEQIRVAKREQISEGGPQKTELHEYKNVVRNKRNQLPYQSSAQKFEGSSLYRHLQGSVISPRQNELPQLSFHKKKGFPDIPKKADIDEIESFSTHNRCSDSFRELLADQNTKREISSGSPVVEKTLYVDSVQKVASPELNSFSSDMKELPKCAKSDLETIAKVGGLEETPLVNYLLKDIGKTNVIDEEGILQPKILNPADSSLMSFSEKSDHKGLEMLKGFGQDQDLLQESMTSASLKLSSNGCLDAKNQHHLTKVENFQELDSRFPLPPPLPKSPSESWLYRTLPSVSSKNSTSHSYLSTRLNSNQQASGTPSVDPIGNDC